MILTACTTSETLHKIWCTDARDVPNASESVLGDSRVGDLSFRFCEPTPCGGRAGGLEPGPGFCAAFLDRPSEAERQLQRLEKQRPGLRIEEKSPKKMAQDEQQDALIGTNARKGRGHRALANQLPILPHPRINPIAEVDAVR